MKLFIVVPFSWFGALFVMYMVCYLESVVLGSVLHEISVYIHKVDARTNFVMNRAQDA